MSMLNRLFKSFQSLWHALLALPQRLLHLVQLFLRRTTRSSRQAGFVLPTVTMVVLVVILTSATLVVRSIDRAKNASNFRVNQVVYNAAAPAVERTKVKLEALFADTSLPRGTPSDASINSVFEGDKYNLDDEVRVQVAFDALDSNGNLVNNGDQSISPDERIITAWRFPVDTDNNGRYDSFTLYGIYFLSADDRPRQPFEARTRPQVLNAKSNACEAAAGTSASLVGTDGWYNQEGVLKKAFYTYVTTVPITSLDTAQGFYLPASTSKNAPYVDRAKYEVYQGNRGFTAMEYQQDRARIPLGNNAIVYEDDLDMASGPPFRINGRIVANSNLFASEKELLRFYQVSSDESCFYEAQNSKIIVGGNVGMGKIQDNEEKGSVQVDLFKGRLNNPGGNDGNNNFSLTDTNKSVDQESDVTAYNNKAYEQRIAFLVNKVMAEHPTPGNYLTATSNDPDEVQNAVQERVSANPELSSEVNRLRSEELEKWFRNRTRRVPAIEVDFGASEAVATAGGNYLDYGGSRKNLLRPIDQWILPTQGDTRLTYRADRLPQVNPEDPGDDIEHFVGDRVLVGNNLPSLWWDSVRQAFATDKTQNTLHLNGRSWWAPGGGESAGEGARYRLARTQRLDDVGVTGRDGFWEINAAKAPEKKNEATGGLRVVTGAGIYLPAEMNATGNPYARSPQPESIVWPDWMPQPPDAVAPGLSAADLALHPYRSRDAAGALSGRGIVERYELNGSTYDPVYIDDADPATPAARKPKRPYLKMRASVVYHYRYPDQKPASDTAPDLRGTKPIACVSSFYDPTDWKTARNREDLPDYPGNQDISSAIANSAENNAANLLASGKGFSNNGIVYRPVDDSYGGWNPNDDRYVYQANLVYPNGRLVNPMLKKALEKARTQGKDKLTLAERSAVDAMLCSFQILDNPTGNITTNPQSGFDLAHGTIQEVSFLDARQIKSIEKPDKAATDGNRYRLQPKDKGQSDVNNGIPQYDLELEHRQPMEIRATVIDLKKLRREPRNPNTVNNGIADANTYPVPEYMLPVSGIVYATRDDAIADASDRPAQPTPQTGDPATDLLNNEPFMQTPVDKVSSTDYWLDPTRRPNGIVLVNGRELNREDNNNFNEAEKGLTLVTNLPVYIKAETAPAGRLTGFNIHEKTSGGTVEEFTRTLTPDWSNFYDRTEGELDPNFACRKPVNGQPLPNCTDSDKWRVANILSDATTLLSDQFRFGFRNEGNYDLDNHQTDNLFRDPRVFTAARSVEPLDRVMFSYLKEQRALMWPNRRMAEEYGFPDLFNSDSNSPDPNNYPNIRNIRTDLGFPTENSFAINGLSSKRPSNDPTNYPNEDTFIRGGLDIQDLGYSAQNAANPRPDNGLSTPTNTSPVKFLNSSYFNNFVTPVQRRIPDPRYEYVMETCLKLPVSQCKPEDWFFAPSKKASDAVNEDISVLIAANADENAGTTARPPGKKWQHFPRRVAFLRATDRINGTIPSASPAPNQEDQYPFLNNDPALGDIHTQGIKVKQRTIGASKEFWAPKPGQLMLDEKIFRPIPLVVLNPGNGNKIACYVYESGYAGRQPGDPDGIGGFNLPTPAPPTPPTTQNSVFFRYSDTGERIECKRFFDMRGNINQLPNALWYATSNSDVNVDLGAKDTWASNIKPLGMRGDFASDFNNLYGPNYAPSNPFQIEKAYKQPFLLPVLQINSVTEVRTPDLIPSGGQPYQETAWLPQSGRYDRNIHFNAVIATGDTPSRKQEANGGVANLPRLLENWKPGGAANEQTTEIKGSFIQLQRSAYATAPFHPLYKNGVNGNFDDNGQSRFEHDQKYPTGNGKFSYYEPAGRQWGFDVGILSQLPDLFSQQFGLPSTDDPNEFFREASRRDDWVEALLCAVAVDPNNRDRITGLPPVINRDQRPERFCQTRARAPF